MVKTPNALTRAIESELVRDLTAKLFVFEIDLTDLHKSTMVDMEIYNNEQKQPNTLQSSIYILLGSFLEFTTAELDATCLIVRG